MSIQKLKKEKISEFFFRIALFCILSIGSQTSSTGNSVVNKQFFPNVNLNVINIPNLFMD